MSIPNRMSPASSHFDRRFRWTVEQFYRASDAGVFDEPKAWELVRGELWKKEQVNPPHAETTERIADLFRSQFSPKYRVREEKPIHLSEDTELVPDFAVVIARGTEYGKRHPGPDDVLLSVEVADTSIYRDTVEKPMIYAQSGLIEYWFSLISTRELVVHREPSSDGYLEIVRLTDNDTVRPLAEPNVEFAVRDLLVPADSDKIE